MSEPVKRGLTSCITIVIVIGLFLCLLFITGAGVMIYSSSSGGPYFYGY
jgi:hypothetical protein